MWEMLCGVNLSHDSQGRMTAHIFLCDLSQVSCHTDKDRSTEDNVRMEDMVCAFPHTPSERACTLISAITVLDTT